MMTFFKRNFVRSEKKITYVLLSVARKKRKIPSREVYDNTTNADAGDQNFRTTALSIRVNDKWVAKK